MFDKEQKGLVEKKKVLGFGHVLCGETMAQMRHVLCCALFYGRRCKGPHIAYPQISAKKRLFKKTISRRIVAKRLRESDAASLVPF